MSPAAAAAADTARDLYERHAREVYSLCLRRLGSREEAEDAAQTVFLNAFGALQRGSRPRFESAWLRRIAENVCIDRRVRARSTRDLHGLEEVLASPEREPGEVAEIERALAGLTETQRRAIVLREWQGLSYREIGAELGLSEGAAEAVAFRARRTLAERLRGTRPGLTLLGWLKPALGGSAVAAKVAAAVALGVAVTGSAAAGYVALRDEPAPAPRPAVPDLRERATGVPVASVSSVSGPRGPAPARPGSGPGTGGAPATSPAPAADRPAPGPTAGTPAVPAADGAPSPVGGTAPTVPAPAPDAKLPVDVPELPVEVPKLPVEVPELPVDTPALPVEPPPLPVPTVETPPLPPLEPPALPPVSPPSVPPLEPPALPPLGGL